MDKKVRILVADDSEDIIEILEILLGGEGYEVITARDGNEAVQKTDDTIDLIILDVNMPYKSGFIASSEIRKKTMAPILFLSARAQESDKTMGFSAGGDDYISKPFSNSELLLRIKSLLRRCYQYQASKVIANNIVEIGDLKVNVDSETVTINGENIILTHTEYKILELLITNRKKIFSMDNIYDSIWGDYMGTVGDNAVMVHIKNLRKKIEKDARNPKYIKTAWGKGYYVD